MLLPQPRQQPKAMPLRGGAVFQLLSFGAPALFKLPVHLAKQADQRGGVLAYALHLHQILCIRLQHCMQRAKGIHQPVRQRVDVGTRNGIKQNQLQNFVRSKAGQPLRQKTLAHTLTVPVVLPGHALLTSVWIFACTSIPYLAFGRKPVRVRIVTTFSSKAPFAPKTLWTQAF